ncbi:MAG: YHS domain-containing protein [Chloroflexi bacterium]|nr:YHS domain-containing protein [Chloroflexota bacterium]
MAIDPACGRKVDKGQSLPVTQYLGQAFYFCSSPCRRQFSKHPEKYLKRLSTGRSDQRAQL